MSVSLCTFLLTHYSCWRSVLIRSSLCHVVTSIYLVSLHQGRSRSQLDRTKEVNSIFIGYHYKLHLLRADVTISQCECDIYGIAKMQWHHSLINCQNLVHVFTNVTLYTRNFSDESEVLQCFALMKSADLLAWTCNDEESGLCVQQEVEPFISSREKPPLRRPLFSITPRKPALRRLILAQFVLQSSFWLQLKLIH